MKKINYFCISSKNKYKIMDNMHLALVNDYFQKTLGELEENAFGNFFQLFWNKIFPIKGNNSDLYFQNIFLIEKYFSLNQLKEIKDISDSMNYILNFDYNSEIILDKDMIEHIGNILIFGFNKIKNKFKIYLIKSFADFKEKIENVKFNQIDLLNEYYNQEIFQKKSIPDKNIKKYIYHISNKENNLLPNELILLLNKLQYIKTISFHIDTIFDDIEMIKYLIILINIQWFLPNLLVVNFDISNLNFSYDLIDIISLKYFLDKKTYYPKLNKINTNYDLVIKNNKKDNLTKEKIPKINLDVNNEDEDEYKIKIKELYNNYINKYNKSLDLIIITTYYIRIFDKLHALNIQCPDIFSSEMREVYNDIKNIKEINFLNLLIDINHLNILNIQFNSLDFSNFEKILGMINSNINLSSLKLIFFSQDKFYSLSGIYKLINDINDPNINLDLLLNNNNFENFVLNEFLLENFQKNLEILCILIRNRRKTMNELSFVLNIPSILVTNNNYILSLIKFIINIFIFLCFDKNQIKIFKLIAPLIKLDNRKSILLNEFFGKIDKNCLNNIHTLFLQLNFCKINNIVNLLNNNLNTLNIGNFDFYTFENFVIKYTSDEFISESKLVNIKIILKEDIIKYDNNIKNIFLKLFQKNPKKLSNFEIITNLKINNEQLREIISLIKKNYVNKYYIVFNKDSKIFGDENIDKELYNNIVVLNEKNEEKLKNIAKIIINKIKIKNDDKNIEKRKKIFNNIKTMIFDKKEIKIDY